MNLATNRQKKVLRFFGIDFGSDLSIGAAGWEIDNLFCSEENLYYWNKYLYLTKDYDVDSDSLIEFDLEEFNSTILPLDWDGRDEVKKFQDELVKNIISDASPKIAAGHGVEKLRRIMRYPRFFQSNLLRTLTKSSIFYSDTSCILFIKVEIINFFTVSKSPFYLKNYF